MMRKVLSFAVAIMASTACSMAWADEPVGCDKFKWPIDRERAALTALQLPNVATGSDLPADKAAVVILLRPIGDAALPSPPERAPKPDTYGGYVKVNAIPSAGIYTVSLSTGGWVDVLQNGAFLKPQAFSGVTGCDGIRKSMKYQLAAGPAVIQVSGIVSDSLTLALLPVVP
jgi:hypothetical protein